MKKAIAIFTALSLALGMTACQSSERETYFEENSAGEIVDSSLLEKIEQDAQPLNTHISGDFKQHTVSGGQTSNITLSDKYAYIFWFMGDMGYIKVDLQTGEAIPLCDVAGCTHDYNQFPGCVNNSYWLDPTAVGDAIWHTEENKLLESKDGETKVLYENSFCNEFEKATFTEYKNEMYYIFDLLVDDDYVYLFGGAHVTLLDRNTLEEVKTIDLTVDSRLYDFSVYGGKIYFTDDLYELYTADIESGEITKIADQVYGILVQEGVLYYVTYVDGGHELYSADPDFKNPKLIAKGFYIDQCAIKNGKVYYIPRSDETVIMCHDIESGEETKIYEGENSILGVGYSDFCDRIFFTTESVPDKETLEPYNLLISIRTDGSDLWVKRFDGETWKN